MTFEPNYDIHLLCLPILPTPLPFPATSPWRSALQFTCQAFDRRNGSLTRCYFFLPTEYHRRSWRMAWQARGFIPGQHRYPGTSATFDTTPRCSRTNFVHAEGPARCCLVLIMIWMRIFSLLVFFLVVRLSCLSGRVISSYHINDHL